MISDSLLFSRLEHSRVLNKSTESCAYLSIESINLIRRAEHSSRRNWNGREHSRGNNVINLLGVVLGATVKKTKLIFEQPTQNTELSLNSPHSPHPLSSLSVQGPRSTTAGLDWTAGLILLTSSETSQSIYHKLLISPSNWENALWMHIYFHRESRVRGFVFFTVACYWPHSFTLRIVEAAGSLCCVKCLLLWCQIRMIAVLKHL